MPSLSEQDGSEGATDAVDACTEMYPPAFAGVGLGLQEECLSFEPWGLVVVGDYMVHSNGNYSRVNDADGAGMCMYVLLLSSSFSYSCFYGNRGQVWVTFRPPC